MPDSPPARCSLLTAAAARGGFFICTASPPALLPVHGKGILICTPHLSHISRGESCRRRAQEARQGVYARRRV